MSMSPIIISLENTALIKDFQYLRSVYLKVEAKRVQTRSKEAFSSLFLLFSS